MFSPKKSKKPEKDIILIQKIVETPGYPEWTRVKVRGERPIARIAQSALMYKNILVLFGGINQKARLNDLWYFNPATTIWYRVLPHSTLPIQRSNHSACIQDGDMIVFGGDTGDQCINDLWAFDFEHEEWHPVPIAQGSEPPPSPRCRHSCCTFGNKIVIFGGCDFYGNSSSKSSTSYYDDMYLFDMHTMKWMKIEYRSKEKPCPRAGATLSLIGSKMYLFGGFGEEKHHSDIWEFNPITLCWSAVEPQQAKEENQTPEHHRMFKRNTHNQSNTQPCGRTGHSAFVVENSLFIFGGYLAGSVRDDLWEFDVTTAVWKRHTRSLSNRNRRRRANTGGAGKPDDDPDLITDDNGQSRYMSPTARTGQVMIPLTPYHFLMFGGIGYESTIPRSDMWVFTTKDAERIWQELERDFNPQFHTDTQAATPRSMSASSVFVVGVSAGEEDEETGFIKTELMRISEEMPAAIEDGIKLASLNEVFVRETKEEKKVSQKQQYQVKKHLEAIRTGINLLRDYENKRWTSERQMNEEMWATIKALQNSLEQEMITYNQRVKETRDRMRDEEQQMNNKTDSLQQTCEDESNRMFDEAEKEIKEIEDDEDRKRQELDNERISEEKAEKDKITELQKGQEDLVEHVIEETMNELCEREENRRKEEGERQEQQLDEKCLKEKQLMKDKGDEILADIKESDDRLITEIQKAQETKEEITQRVNEERKQLRVCHNKTLGKKDPGESLEASQKLDQTNEKGYVQLVPLAQLKNEKNTEGVRNDKMTDILRKKEEELIALLQKVRDIDAKVTELEENSKTRNEEGGKRQNESAKIERRLKIGKKMNQEAAILLQVLEGYMTSTLSDPFLNEKRKESALLWRGMIKREKERRRKERTEDTILAKEEHGDEEDIEPDTLADSESDEEYSLMDLDDETSSNVSAVDAQMDLDERNERKHDFRFILPQKDKHKETGPPGDPFGGNYLGPDSEGMDDIKPYGEGSEMDWENSSIIDANPLPLFTSPVNVTFTEEKMMWLRAPFLSQDERKEMFTKKTRRVLHEEGTRLNDEQQTQLMLQLGTKAINEKKEHIISARDEGVGNIKQTINTRVAKTDERLERYCKAGEERAYQAAIGDRASSDAILAECTETLEELEHRMEEMRKKDIKAEVKEETGEINKVADKLDAMYRLSATSLETGEDPHSVVASANHSPAATDRSHKSTNEEPTSTEPPAEANQMDDDNISPNQKRIQTLKAEADALLARLTKQGTALEEEPELNPIVIESIVEKLSEAESAKLSKRLTGAHDKVNKMKVQAEDETKEAEERCKVTMATAVASAEKRVNVIEKILSKHGLELSEWVKNKQSAHNTLLSQISSRTDYVWKKMEERKKVVKRLEEEWKECKTDLATTISTEANVQISMMEREVRSQLETP
ncbi:putative Tip elongation aberrant protein 1 [Blattamonas nauphoetae]|uniref:Tip elongation aberrant protein 1 n=1 Tax=Blattamonas nauphoetae TaxID=2049346 RepID=A0ABQ9Y9B2_9EUKA|nr:putative Tip elongation aberrant protein 1 [Blattamonas nauphoetae]